MQVSCRHLGSNENDHELIWLAVSLGSLGIAALWFWLGLQWPGCVFHQLTGLPCMTCGMTRSGIEFFHGRFLAALKWNPLVFAILCGVTAFDLYGFFALVTRAPRLRIIFWTASEKKVARIIVITALALNWVYLLLHCRQV